MTASATVVSAPGKALIAGGYLVLDPTYPGLVIATDSRFYTVIEAKSGQSISSGSTKAASATIQVRSPQFLGAFWEYSALLSTHEGRERCQLRQTEQTFKAKEAGENPFLSLAILYSLKLATEIKGAAHVSQVLGHGLNISVVGDNDFYSQRPAGEDKVAPTTKYLSLLPPFNKQPCAIRHVNKTGLGSSAAMTTSVVGALLVHLCGPSLSSQAEDSFRNGDKGSSGSLSRYALALIHNLAQLSHCAAQGKVGSGFDVSSATWGSQLFRRFDPAVLEPLMTTRALSKVSVEGAAEEEGPDIELLPHLSPHNSLWTPSPLTSVNADQGTHPTAVEGLAAPDLSLSAPDDRQRPIAQPAPLQLPPRLHLALADVNAGSNTRTLVGNVSKWKKEKPAYAAQLFKVIGASNQSLADGLLSLRLSHAQDPAAYDSVVELAASKKSKEWDDMMRSSSPSETLRLLIDVRNALRSIRAGMRELGRLAQADIEPREMCRLLDASVDAAPGILGGGVPGAGGYDALYILHLSPASHAGEADTCPARKGVEDFWASWKPPANLPDMSVGPLLSTAGGAVPLDPIVSEAAAPDQDSSGTALARELQQALKLSAEGKQEVKAGLCIEKLDEVRGLREALARAQ